LGKFGVDRLMDEGGTWASRLRPNVLSIIWGVSEPAAADNMVDKLFAAASTSMEEDSATKVFG